MGIAAFSVNFIAILFYSIQIMLSIQLFTYQLLMKYYRFHQESEIELWKLVSLFSFLLFLTEIQDHWRKHSFISSFTAIHKMLMKLTYS